MFENKQKHILVLLVMAALLLSGCAGGGAVKRSQAVSAELAPEGIIELKPREHFRLLQGKKLNLEHFGRFVAVSGSARRTSDDSRTNAYSMLIVGDSLSVGLGAMMASIMKENQAVVVRPEGKISTGLNTAWFFDWEKKLRELIDEEKPDVLVVLIGGNDAFNGPGSSEWEDKFRMNVQSFLQIASENDIEVFWVELPPMKKDDFTRKVKTANYVMESVCSKIGNCHFVDTWRLCADKEGKYAVVKKINDNAVMLRVDDGAHFTKVGYELLGRYVLEQISSRISWPSAPQSGPAETEEDEKPVASVNQER